MTMISHRLVPVGVFLASCAFLELATAQQGTMSTCDEGFVPVSGPPLAAFTKISVDDDMAVCSTGTTVSYTLPQVQWTIRGTSSSEAKISSVPANIVFPTVQDDGTLTFKFNPRANTSETGTVGGVLIEVPSLERISISGSDLYVQIDENIDNLQRIDVTASNSLIKGTIGWTSSQPVNVTLALGGTNNQIDIAARFRNTTFMLNGDSTNNRIGLLGDVVGGLVTGEGTSFLIEGVELGVVDVVSRNIGSTWELNNANCTGIDFDVSGGSTCTATTQEASGSQPAFPCTLSGCTMTCNEGELSMDCSGGSGAASQTAMLWASGRLIFGVLSAALFF